MRGSQDVPDSCVPALTVDEMREVDRAMVHDFHIGLDVMMENAGWALADLAHRRFRPHHAVVLAGPGGNGGGGLAAARHLSNRGVTATVVLSRPAPDLAPATVRQLDIVQRIGVPILDEPPDGDLVIDALIGYSLRGDPTGRASELIAWANDQPAPVLALDVPSGLDATSGRVGEPCARAEATLTLALPRPAWRTHPTLSETCIWPTSPCRQSSMNAWVSTSARSSPPVRSSSCVSGERRQLRTRRPAGVCSASLRRLAGTRRLGAGTQRPPRRGPRRPEARRR